MSNVIKFPSEKRVKAGATQAENPFLNTELYERMRAHMAAETVVAEELQAIEKRGAGARGVDPITAPSLHVLRQTKRAGTTLGAALVNMAQGVDLGPSESVLGKFGLQCWDSGRNRGGQTGWNARLALDMSTHSNATTLFTKAGVSNWRSLVAEDAAEIQIEMFEGPLITKAVAIFYIGDRTEPA